MRINQLLYGAVFCAVVHAAAMDLIVELPKKSASGYNIDLDKGANSLVIVVKLNQAPSENYRVHFEADSLQISPCYVEFNRNNWKGVKVTVSLSRTFSLKFTPNNKHEVHTYLRATLDGNPCEKLVEKIIPISFLLPTGRQCTSIGDPHFVLFNGKELDYQGRGVVTLMKTASTLIQARQVQYAKGAASVNSQLLVQYMDSFRFVTIDPAKKQAATSFKNGKNKIGYHEHKGIHTIAIPDGTTIIMSNPVNKAGTFMYGNIDIRVPGSHVMHLDKDNGICGSLHHNIDKSQFDAKFLKTNKAQGIMPCLTSACQSMQGYSFRKCTLPKLPSRKCPTKPTPSYGKQPSPPTKTTTMPPELNSPPINDLSIFSKDHLCTKAFVSQACGFVGTSVIVSACIADAALGVKVEDAVLFFTNFFKVQCKEHYKLLLDSKDPISIALAIMIKQKYVWVDGTAVPTPGPTPRPSPTPGPTPAPTPSGTNPTPGPTPTPSGTNPTPGPTPAPTPSGTNPTPGPTPTPSGTNPTPGPTPAPGPAPSNGGITINYIDVDIIWMTPPMNVIVVEQQDLTELIKIMMEYTLIGSNTWTLGTDDSRPSLPPSYNDDGTYPMDGTYSPVPPPSTLDVPPLFGTYSPVPPPAYNPAPGPQPLTRDQSNSRPQPGSGSPMPGRCTGAACVDKEIPGGFAITSLPSSAVGLSPIGLILAMVVPFLFVA